MTSLQVPNWAEKVLGAPLPSEGEVVDVRGQRLLLRDGVFRAEVAVSPAQQHTESGFAYKWSRRETFDSSVSLSRMRDWLLARYGDVGTAPWWTEYGDAPLVLDAGCGAGMSAFEAFASVLGRIRYVGVDISSAIDVARQRLDERGGNGLFLQADLMGLPLPERSFDVIFSEGVLHHTDCPEAALHALARHLRPGGRILFYVYRRKGPIREFTDDYIREQLRDLPPERAWDALMPLSRLGIALGELAVEVDVPEEVALLEIPAGRIDVQRLVYWHIFKAFHSPDLDLDEINHINFDWFYPRNAHRQTADEVRSWCAAAHLTVEREVVEAAGITIIAKAPD